MKTQCSTLSTNNSQQMRGLEQNGLRNIGLGSRGLNIGQQRFRVDQIQKHCVQVQNRVDIKNLKKTQGVEVQSRIQ